MLFSINAPRRSADRVPTLYTYWWHLYLYLSCVVWLTLSEFKVPVSSPCAVGIADGGQRLAALGATFTAHNRLQPSLALRGRRRPGSFQYALFRAVRVAGRYHLASVAPTTKSETE